MNRIWVSDPDEHGGQVMVTQYQTRHPDDEPVHVARRMDRADVWGPPIECKPDKYSRKREDTTDTTREIKVTLPEDGYDFVTKIAEWLDQPVEEIAETFMRHGANAFIRKTLAESDMFIIDIKVKDDESDSSN